ncbi:hypothetical protein OH738_29390 [Streptomyces hirsutus]|uniref:hypothetical protein n=1 Tax=Streptomyces hirsutus TaxID=35620 RepID=UPI00386BAECD|nr:hypothetical protein OH738_29390 [Streptomyces hirsutus]
MQHNVQPSMPLCGARRPGWERPGPGRHRLPCILPAGHTGTHRDALRQTWDGPSPASADADLMRVDAPQVDRCTALDGQCTGEYCGENGDPREPIHHGPEHGLNVSFADDPLIPFQLTQWEDEPPLLTVYAGGVWPDLSLAQVDELLLAFEEYTGALRVAREHLARAVAVQDAQDATEDAQDAHGEGR